MQFGVDRQDRGRATSLFYFSRLLGQAVGAAVMGGVLNAGLAAGGPETHGALRALMDPASRVTLLPAELARLVPVLAGALHGVFAVALVLALLTVPAALSAAAGVVRWGVMGTTVALPALVAVQALHGLTFALMHLAAMRVIGTAVPERLGATAQAAYGNIALGMASAVLTFASGYLYDGLGLHAFWAMAALCLAALAVVPGMRAAVRAPGRP